MPRLPLGFVGQLHRLNDHLRMDNHVFGMHLVDVLAGLSFYLSSETGTMHDTLGHFLTLSHDYVHQLPDVSLSQY